MKSLYFTFFFLSICSITKLAQINVQVPVQTLPHFLFYNLDNKPFTDTDLHKGPALFIMYFDPDGDHCQRAMAFIGEHFQAFKKMQVALVSGDNESKINQFMNTYGSKVKGQKNVIILVDELQQFNGKFNPLRYPAMYIFSSGGKLLDYDDSPESVFRMANTINKDVK